MQNRSLDKWVSSYMSHPDKTNKMACAPSEDSDQPGHPHSLIRASKVYVDMRLLITHKICYVDKQLKSIRLPYLDL